MAWCATGTRIYCNAHFRQLFATTGDYRFAQEENAPAAASVAEATAAATPASPVAANSVADVAAPTTALGTVVAADSKPQGEEAEGEGSEQEGEEATCYLYGDLRIPFAVEEGWLRVRDSECAQNWMLLSYARSDPNCIEVVGEGSGGLRECLALTTDDRCFWGGFRVSAAPSHGVSACNLSHLSR